MLRIDCPSFGFSFVSLVETLKKINKLINKKAFKASDIPVKTIKENKDLIAYFINKNFNNAWSCSQYPNDLKNADVTPVFKMDHKSDKSTYRPMSILRNLSKIHERLMQNLMCSYFHKISSKYQCDFRRHFNTQYYLMSVMEKWRRCLHAGSHAGALLTNLSKAIYCINQDLLIATFKDYGFDTTSLNFIYSYLTGKKQRGKEFLHIVPGQKYFSVYYKAPF